MNKKNFYSGQAIAIVMVVLVVAAVLGASLYSRTIQNQDSAIDIQDSDTSLEQVDTILELFSEVDIDQLDLLAPGDGEDAVVFDDIDDFVNSGSLFSDVAKGIVDNLDDNWCEEGASGLEIRLSRLPESEAIDVSVGNTRAYNFDGASISGPSMDLTVQPRGSDTVFFVVKKIYWDGAGSFKPYDLDDTEAYCIGDSCGDFATGTYNSLGSNGEFSVSLGDDGAWDLYEVRVVPIVGSIAVSHDTNGDVSGVEFGYIKINVAVNCYGTEREKELVLPGSSSLSYATTFDYVLYNNGSLSPN